MYRAARPPLRRIMAIDRAMRAGEWPNCTSLGHALEVDPRTIRRDIAFLRDQLRAPVEFDARRRGFYYSEPSYRLPHFQMSEGELLALYLAERLLRTLEGTPFEQDLRGAITKLGDMLPEGISVRLDERADLLAVLPASRPCYDVDAFRTLTSAIVGRRRLEMIYWTASRDEMTRRVFDPYDLAVVEDGWYAVGHCHLRGEVRVFAVQRVRSVRQTGETFDRPVDFRVEDYMQGSFRAVRGDGDHRIVLRFSSAVASRVAERQWHPSQTIERRPDGGLVLTLHLSSLIEIKRWVLSWGAACEVLGPGELCEAIGDELALMSHRQNVERRQPFDVSQARVRIPSP